MDSNDITDAQRKDVEAALRALPGVTGVAYLDQAAAYQRLKKSFSTEPSKMPQVEPEHLPESFEVRMTDIAAVRKIRDRRGMVAALSGVEDVSFPCTTVEECRKIPAWADCTTLLSHPISHGRQARPPARAGMSRARPPTRRHPGHPAHRSRDIRLK